MTDTSGSPWDHTDGGKRSTLDQLFEALSHPYRRRILTAIATRNPQHEDDFTPAEFAGDDEKFEQCLTALHHNHLPRLDEAGFIEWDREAKTIRRGPRYDEIVPLVELLIAHEDELPADWP
jgi:hypothetical protein